MEQAKKLLEKNGVKPSIQRIKILKCLMGNSKHFTAKDIYKTILKEIPTLSKTTVYNTVKLFADKGILQTIRVEEDETRYDIRAELHAHFRCKKCGNIYDLEKKITITDMEEIEGHLIEEKSICYSGICKKCK
jgi:Fur family peroxide stress response transcriptional regulator